MTEAEKQFNKEILYVLKKIKEKSLYTTKNKPIDYWVSFITNDPVLDPEKEMLLIEKIEEMGAITIISKTASPSEIMIEAYVFQLEIKQLKFNEIYEKLREPFKKFEKHKQSLAQSLNKILGILELLKQEWELMPKNLQGDYNYRIRRYEGIEAQISHQTTTGWVRKCGLNDFYQLNSILDTLLEDGLILKADFRNEYA